MNRPIDLAATQRGAPAWAVDLRHRVLKMLPLKFFGVSAFMWLFFVGYFYTLRHPASAVVTMPLTPIDTMLPFQPGWLPAYLSLWLYVGIAPGLLLTFRELVIYGLWAAAMCCVGLGIFYLWPSAVPPLTIDVSGYAGFAMLQGVDAPGNACPSMHVAAAMFTVLWVDRLLREVGTPALLRVANVVWFVAISYSTLAIRQHVLLDAVAGAALGAVFAAAAMRFSPLVVMGRPGR
jgi:membrane-associated phospholipid phosphatase